MENLKHENIKRKTLVKLLYRFMSSDFNERRNLMILQDIFDNYLVYRVKDKYRVWLKATTRIWNDRWERESNVWQCPDRSCPAIRTNHLNFETKIERSSSILRELYKTPPRRLSKDIIGKPLISIQGSLHARSFCQGDTDEGEGRRGRTISLVARDTFNSSAPAEYLINRAVINDASPS